MNEYDDFPESGDEQDRAIEQVLDQARAKATIPGILMIVFGAITFGLAAWNTIDLGNLDRRLDDAKEQNFEQVDRDPKMSDEDKKEMKEMVTRVVDAARQIVPPLIYVNLGTGALLVLGGLSLMRLAARPIVLFACIMGIIPFTTFCCTGFPICIWGLFAWNNATVRAGYRAKSMMR